MEKEFNKCPWCDSTDIKPIQKKYPQRYKCENCGYTFGGEGGPGVGPGNPS